jgi:hypothetical protein
MRTRTHGGNSGVALRGGSRERRHDRPVLFPALLAHSMTAVILRDIMQCVGLFVVKEIALFSTSLHTARNWIESCTGLSARLQLF